MSSEEQRNQLMAALVQLAPMLRRPEPSGDTKLGLGRIMQRNGLEQRHAAALLTIALYGPLSVTELAERHRVSVKTASLIAIQLEEAKLVERREDPADRRRTIVSVAKGRERAVRDGLNKRAAHLERTLNRLTASQRDGLIEGLRVLSEEISRGS
jgi:DNA-binding MarR family transcriptional regulator